MNTDYSGYSSRNNGRRASYPSNNNKNSNTLDGDSIPIKKQYFDFIANGKKTVEGRIYSHPFTKATKGDVVTFINQSQKVTCKITEIVKYKSFKDMLDKEGVRNCLPDISTVDEGVKIYHSIPGYEDKAKKFGVIAVRIEKFTKDQFKTTSSYEVTLPTVKTHSPAAPISSSSNAPASEKLRVRSEDYKKEDDRQNHDRRSENRSERNYHSHESSRTKSPEKKREDRRDSDRRYDYDRRSKDYHSSSSDRKDKYRSDRDYERDKSYSSRSSERKDSSSLYKADAHDHSSKKRKRERDEESSSDAEHKHKKQKTEN